MEEEEKEKGAGVWGDTIYEFCAAMFRLMLVKKNYFILFFVCH